MDGFPADFAATAKAEIRLTEGYVWAGSGPCLTAADFESGLSGRDFGVVVPGHLADYPLHSRWFMGFFLCARDDINVALDWAAKVPPDARRRILILVGPQIPLRDVDDLVGQRAPGCRIDSCDALGNPATAYKAHKKFGAAHAVQAYEDRGLPVL